ncbi:MAG: helix-turn-helix domain-containing protein [Marinobacter sp.]|nr:helix-turn-helix domain-containing protein [Marinobacter sp.]
MAIAPSALRFPAAYVLSDAYPVPVESLLSHFNVTLPTGWRNNPEALIDGDQFSALLNVLSAFIKRGGPQAQARVLKFFPLTIHGYVGLAAMTASTLQQAMDIGVRYFHHVMPAFDTSYTIEGQTCLFAADPISDFGTHNALLAEITMCAVNSVLPFLDLGYNDLTVTFQHDTLEMTEFASFYPGVTVKMGCAQNMMIFPKSALATPLRTGNATTFRMMESELARREQLLATQQTLVYRVFMTIKEHLARGDKVDAQSIAEGLHVSLRTFNRRLNDEGTNFKTIHDQSRLGLAEHLLAHTNKAMVGISSELGFANESSFSRYIKDKTGLSPSQYRKSARGRLNRL